MMNYSKSHRTALVTLASSVVLLGLVGCAGSGNDAQPQADNSAESGVGLTQTPDSAADTAETTQATEDAPSVEVDASEYAAAIAAAEGYVGDAGFAFELDREDDDDDNDELFNIDVAEGTTVHEIDILPDGTARLDETETHELDSDDQREIDTAELTMLEAIEKALAHHSGTIDSVELETENGTVVWTVDYEDNDSIDELHVNAVTGEITVED